MHGIDTEIDRDQLFAADIRKLNRGFPRHELVAGKPRRPSRGRRDQAAR